MSDLSEVDILDKIVTLTRNQDDSLFWVAHPKGYSCLMPFGAVELILQPAEPGVRHATLGFWYGTTLMFTIPEVDALYTLVVNNFRSLAEFQKEVNEDLDEWIKVMGK